MATFNNRLLDAMDNIALEALGDMQLVTLPMRQQLNVSAEIEFVYFLEEGVASVIADVDGRIAVELGIIGHEGMVGLNVVYGDRVEPYKIMMQVDGSAMRIAADRLRHAIDHNKMVHDLTLNFARAFSIQVASTALANGRSKLDARLARWLLMVADRAGMTFPITHEFISIMLGVRRSGVTVAIQVLEGQGVIRASRGSITILDRRGLQKAANGAYGFAEAHYERLLGRSA